MFVIEVLHASVSARKQAVRRAKLPLSAVVPEENVRRNMEDPQMPGAMPPDPPYQTTASQQTYGATQPPYGATQPPYGATQPPYTAAGPGYTQQPYVATAPVAAQGLSDTAAGVLAYITIIPAI